MEEEPSTKKITSTTDNQAADVSNNVETPEIVQTEKFPEEKGKLWKEEYDAAVAKTADEKIRLKAEAARQHQLDAEEKSRRNAELANVAAAEEMAREEARSRYETEAARRAAIDAVSIPPPRPPPGPPPPLRQGSSFVDEPQAGSLQRTLSTSSDRSGRGFGFSGFGGGDAPTGTLQRTPSTGPKPPPGPPPPLAHPLGPSYRPRQSFSEPLRASVDGGDSGGGAKQGPKRGYYR